MNFILIVAALLVCAVGSTSGIFLQINNFLNQHRRKLCNNYTAIDLDWEKVIEPLNNWNLFYMNYYESSFHETGQLSTCVQINYTRTNSQTQPGDVIGKFTATRYTTSNTNPDKQIRYIYQSIADVTKLCQSTWTVSIPERGISNKVTIPIYDVENSYFCLANCNNQCGVENGEELPTGTFECYGKNKQAAKVFKQEHPNLAKAGTFLQCSLES